MLEPAHCPGVLCLNWYVWIFCLDKVHDESIDKAHWGEMESESEEEYESESEEERDEDDIAAGQ